MRGLRSWQFTHTAKGTQSVTPAKAGAQGGLKGLDSRLRGNDE